MPNNKILWTIGEDTPIVDIGTKTHMKSRDTWCYQDGTERIGTEEDEREPVAGWRLCCFAIRTCYGSVILSLLSTFRFLCFCERFGRPWTSFI